MVLMALLLELNVRGVVHTGYVFNWVPFIFVLFGLWRVVARRFGRSTELLWMVFAAGLFQLVALGIFRSIIVALWWPLVFMLTGQAVAGMDRHLPLLAWCVPPLEGGSPVRRGELGGGAGRWTASE